MGALALRFRSLLIGVVCLLLSAGLVFAGGGFELLGDSDGATGGSAPAVTENGDGEAADNHGDLVSQAADMAAPLAAEGTEGFKNHGAFVSCVAKLAYGKKGVVVPADFDLATLTPDDCDGDDEDEVVTDDPVVEDLWDSHGDLVSEAAEMETLPADFETRGAFVSCVAKMAYGKTGSEAPVGFTLAGLTADACEQAEEDAAVAADDGPGKSDQAKAKGKGHGNGKGNGRGR